LDFTTHSVLAEAPNPVITNAAKNNCPLVEISSMTVMSLDYKNVQIPMDILLILPCV